MEESEYNAYIERAEFFNATGRTLEGLHGMLFAKNPVINIDEQFLPYLDNVDGEGSSFNQFISDCAYSSLMFGYGGVLVDAPSADGIKSQREAEEKNIVPFMKFYKPQDIFEVRTSVVGRKRAISFVKLREYEERQSLDSEFVFEKKEIYRVLSLSEDGYYRQRVYNSDGTLRSEVYPMKNGYNLREIPFFTLPNKQPTKSILQDLVSVNLAWYRKSADLENGAHWTGVPTPYVIGYEPPVKYDKDGKEIPEDPIALGGSTMIAFPESVKAVNYLEFSGSGLGQLMSLMASDEERMAILGAKIISSEKKGVESARAAEIHRSGEKSVLARFSNSLSISFTKILNLYIEWVAGVDNADVSVTVNTDFDLTQMDPSQITAMVSCWQSGGVSKKVLFGALKKGEIIPTELTFDDMQQEIEEEQEKELQKRVALQSVVEDAQ